MSVLKDIINKAVETAENLPPETKNFTYTKKVGRGPNKGVYTTFYIKYNNHNYVYDANRKTLHKSSLKNSVIAELKDMIIVKYWLDKNVSATKETVKKEKVETKTKTKPKTPTPAAAFTKSLSNIKKLLAETESARIRSVIAKGTLKSQMAYKKQIVEIEKQLRTILADLT